MMPIANKASLFKKYPNPYFLETGSNEGEGIQAALDAGFPQIYSIELLDNFYSYCMNKFSQNPNVHLFKGDSGLILADILSNIDDKITFWLDGHSSGGSPKGIVSSPLILEFEQIKGHRIKDHTILIDDLRSWQREYPEIGFNIDDIKAKILEINPSYTFEYIDGNFPNDILAATTNG